MKKAYPTLLGSDFFSFEGGVHIREYSIWESAAYSQLQDRGRAASHSLQGAPCLDRGLGAHLPPSMIELCNWVTKPCL